jgi:hypothetical protein
MKNNYRYLKVNINTTIDDLKKQYKAWAFRLHPDVGGTDEAMKILNSEYEAAIAKIGKNLNKKYSYDEDFITIIDELIRLNMKNVTVEIMGFFIWVYGNTKPYKDQLKALKLWWHSKKKCWYYKPNWYVKKGRKQYSFEEIRNAYGSTIVDESQKSSGSKNTNNDFIPALT